jgi:hypothetical protein
LRYIESLKEEISNNPGVTALVRAARDWGTVYGTGKRPVLTMEDYGDKIAITDTRTCAVTPGLFDISSLRLSI